MRPQTRPPPAWCSVGSYACTVTDSSGLLRTRSSLRPTTWRISWIGCIIFTITSVNIWRFPVTWWRPTTTVWPILRDSRKETNSSCTVQLRPEESHLSCSYPWKALHHQDQRRGSLDPATSEGKDFGGRPGQTGTILGATRDEHPLGWSSVASSPALLQRHSRPGVMSAFPSSPTP
jgi:hypothetical protein